MAVDSCIDTMRGSLILLRHGQTAWSISGQHTGRTNVPLTEEGRAQARRAGERITAFLERDIADIPCFSSPLIRANTTAQLAGFHNITIHDSLAEWDYGPAEGRTCAEISEKNGGKPWNLWVDGLEAVDSSFAVDRQEILPDGTVVDICATRGEALVEAYERTQSVIDDVVPLLDRGETVVCVAHAHILRILTMKWLGMPPVDAQLLRMETAHFSVLSEYRGQRVIEHWNM